MHQPSGVALSGTGPSTMAPLITPLWGDYCADFLVAFRLLMQVVGKTQIYSYIPELFGTGVCSRKRAERIILGFKEDCMSFKAINRLIFLFTVKYTKTKTEI
jgi:hypothetical protein